MRMGFRVFFGNAQVKDVRVEHKAVFRDLELFDLVVLFGIKDMFAVGGEVFSEMHIIAVAAQAFPVVGNDLDGAFFNFLEYAGVGKDHIW